MNVQSPTRAAAAAVAPSTATRTLFAGKHTTVIAKPSRHFLKAELVAGARGKNLNQNSVLKHHKSCRVRQEEAVPFSFDEQNVLDDIVAVRGEVRLYERLGVVWVVFGKCVMMSGDGLHDV
jgi:hypothetical protein